MPRTNRQIVQQYARPVVETPVQIVTEPPTEPIDAGGSTVEPTPENDPITESFNQTNLPPIESNDS